MGAKSSVQLPGGAHVRFICNIQRPGLVAVLEEEKEEVHMRVLRERVERTHLKHRPPVMTTLADSCTGGRAVLVLTQVETLPPFP